MKMQFYILNNVVALLILTYLNLVNAYLNLYLSLSEVQRLLGLPAELYYIRNGNINSYALNFVVPIPSKLESLHFTWESLTGQLLAYSIKVDTSNSPALPPPKLNISSIGSIPNSIQTFTISLPCSGAVEAEVDIAIIINITVSNDNVTTLTFRRKKICHQFQKSTSYTLTDSMPQFSNSTNIFYIAVCCGVLLIIIIALLVTLYYIRGQNSRGPIEGISGPTTTTTTFLAALPRNSINASSYDSFRRMPSYSLIDERSKDLQDRITDLTVQRDYQN